jgi:phosphoribosylpyrophosphate synthetase
MLLLGVKQGDNFIENLKKHLETELSKGSSSEEVDFFPIEYKAFDDGESRFRLSDGSETNEQMKSRVKSGERIIFVVRGTCGRDWKPYEMLGQTDFVLEKLKEYETPREKICTVIPCQPFAKQDKSFRHGEAVSLRSYRTLVSEYSGLLINVSVHDHREEGWVEKTIYNVDVMPDLVEHLKSLRLDKPLIVVPDAGARGLSQYIANELEADTVVLRKKRDKKTGDPVFAFPEYLTDDAIKRAGYKEAIYGDDMGNTGRTLRIANEPARRAGLRIIDEVIHPILAYTRVKDGGSLASYIADMEQRIKETNLSELPQKDRERIKKMHRDLKISRQLWCYDIITDVTEDFYASDTVCSPINAYSVVRRLGNAILENFK